MDAKVDMTFICTKASRIPVVYCLGAKGPQVKSMWAKELDISHVQFKEPFLYSRFYRLPVQWKKMLPLHLLLPK